MRTLFRKTWILIFQFICDLWKDIASSFLASTFFVLNTVHCSWRTFISFQSRGRYNNSILERRKLETVRLSLGSRTERWSEAEPTLLAFRIYHHPSRGAKLSSLYGPSNSPVSCRARASAWPSTVWGDWRLVVPLFELTFQCWGFLGVWSCNTAYSLRRTTSSDSHL